VRLTLLGSYTAHNFALADDGAGAALWSGTSEAPAVCQTGRRVSTRRSGGVLAPVVICGRLSRLDHADSVLGAHDLTRRAFSVAASEAGPG
jgi:hypothetical protein